MGFKKSKPITTPPYGVGLKSLPIPAPPPLRGGKNPRGTKRGWAGLPSIFLSEMIYVSLFGENFYFLGVFSYE